MNIAGLYAALKALAVPLLSGSQVAAGANQGVLGVDGSGNVKNPDGTAFSASSIGAVAFVSGLVGNSSGSASANDAALATALATGGYVYVPSGLGDIYITLTKEVRSNTQLIIGPGSRLKRGGSHPFHMIRNYSAHGGVYVNGLTISGGVFTMPETGHPYNVGDTIYCEGFLGNSSLNGPQVVTAVAAGVSWSFAASGSAPTNTATQLAFTSRYQPLAGSNFSRASTGVVTVTDSSHVFAPGDHVYVAGIPIGTSSFNGAQVVTGVVPGVSWTYLQSATAVESGTGTAQVLGDYNIGLDLSLDGNGQNLTNNTNWFCHTSMWENLSRVNARFRDCKGALYGRVASWTNVASISIPDAYASGPYNHVLFQFDSFCDRVSIGTADGETLLDDVIAWGSTSNTGTFGDTAPATGPGNMGTLTVGEIKGNSPTGLLKLFCVTGVDDGRVHVGRITGTGPINIGDSHAGVAGGTITSIQIDDVDNLPQSNTNQIAIGTATGAFSQIGNVRIGKLVDNAPSTTAITYCVSVACPVTSLAIDEWILPVARSASNGYAGLFSANIGTFKIGRMNSTCANHFMYLNAGTIDVFQVNNWTHTGTANSNIQMIYFAGAYCNNIYLDKCRFSTGGGPLGFNYQTAAQTWNIFLSNIEYDNCGQGIGCDTSSSSAVQTFNIYATNVHGTAFGNRFLQFSNSYNVVRFVGRGISMPANKWLVTSSNNASLSIDCKEFQIDLGANGASPPSYLVSPVAGDQVYNVDATGPGTYGYTAAGAWTKLY